MKVRWATIFLILGLAALSVQAAPKKEIIRVGYFPNITHAQAVIGMADGTFQKVLGNDIEIRKFIFNAGPSVIEAMFARQLDLAYIGPNPAINGYLKTNGALLKIISGAASGGAALVVRSDLKVKNIKQLAGKKIASPQLGNTQDIALRSYLKSQGMKLREQGGDVTVLPIPNPDQLNLFLKKEIDAAWTVEPWVTRLVEEAGGVVLLDERTLWPEGMFVTAHIIATQDYLKKKPQIIKKWLQAHVLITQRINRDKTKAAKNLIQELQKLTGSPLPEKTIQRAFANLDLTYEPLAHSLYVSAERAYDLGFLGKKKPDLSKIYDLRLLNEVLRELKLPPVKTE
ncbi:MAG: ABC transporter substrate-binding protein [Firmicutes bacterium]|nr:ABC transporter substrate-binding protein [Bacillota bacterium]